eukprot:1580752-Prymnesium_polylepis.1
MASECSAPPHACPSKQRGQQAARVGHRRAAAEQQIAARVGHNTAAAGQRIAEGVGHRAAAPAPKVQGRRRAGRRGGRHVAFAGALTELSRGIAGRHVAFAGHRGASRGIAGRHVAFAGHRGASQGHSRAGRPSCSSAERLASDESRATRRTCDRASHTRCASNTRPTERMDPGGGGRAPTRGAASRVWVHVPGARGSMWRRRRRRRA